MFMPKETIIKKDTPEWILKVTVLLTEQILEREAKKSEDLVLESFGDRVAGGSGDDEA